MRVVDVLWTRLDVPRRDHDLYPPPTVGDEDKGERRGGPTVES